MPDQQEAASVSGEINRDAKTSWEDVKNSTTSKETSATSEPTAEVSKEETKPEVTPNANIDYEAELAKYKAKAEREEATRKYERAERKRLEKELEAKSSEETVEVETETPDLDAIVERKLDSIRRAERQDFIDEKLEELSDNPTERELVKQIYEQRLKPTGFSKKAIGQDLEEAFLIANRTRLETIAFQKAKEKVRSGMAQEKAMLNQASTGGSVGREPPEATPNYNSTEMKWLSRVGKSKAE